MPTQNGDIRRSGRNPGMDRWIADIKAALPLGDTITRISGIRLEPCSSGTKACCPFHNDSTPSFFVNDSTGRYRCYGAGCGAQGDVVQFIREWHSVGFGEALRMAGELAGIPRPEFGRNHASGPAAGDEPAWRSVIRGRSTGSPILRPAAEFLSPVPEGIALPVPGRRVSVHDPVRKRSISMLPTHVHAYRSVDNSVLCLVLRANARNGRKFFIQAGWNDGPEGTGWRLVRFPRDVARPLYGLSKIQDWASRDGSRILLVEGEKTRDAAAVLLPPDRTGLLSLSAMGGGAAVRHADWSPVAKTIRRLHLGKQAPVEILIWPDADMPTVRRDGRPVDRQLQFARDAAGPALQAFREVGRAVRFTRILAPDNVPGGWDLADALEQGWTAEKTSVHLGRFRIPLDGFDVGKCTMRDPLPSGFKLRTTHEPTGSD